MMRFAKYEQQLKWFALFLGILSTIAIINDLYPYTMFIGLPFCLIWVYCAWLHTEKQLKWIESRLVTATKAKERVMLFCHFPVFPKNGHNLWNDKVLTELLARYPCVVAYINGHNHAGNYGQRDGIHYLTLKGMVDTEENSYAVIEVYADRLVVKGFGRERSRELPLPDRHQ